ncbi:MAG: hypothetical protein ACE5GI_03170 [Candidatus Aminicenantales bacterium]
MKSVNDQNRQIVYQFVPYGKQLEPQKDRLVLDVGMKTVPGVIDHHHPQAEKECTASLIVKHPQLVLDHLYPEGFRPKNEPQPLFIITHRFPDFDAVASIFLSLKLSEKGEIDDYLEKIAAYTKMIDSARLPKEIDLPSTPYSILRALFKKIRGDERQINLARIKEGLIFMNFLYTKAGESYDIFQNRLLFSGIEKYERAMREAEDDYFDYLLDLKRSLKIKIFLPLISSQGGKKVDGLIVRNPKSYLLKEWARRDRENSSFKQGFSFLMTNIRNKRYILGVDPEQKIYLRGLGGLLNQKEEIKRKEQGRPFNYRWYEGNCPFFNYRIIDSPLDGTRLSHQEIVDTLLSFSQNIESKYCLLT